MFEQVTCANLHETSTLSTNEEKSSGVRRTVGPAATDSDQRSHESRRCPRHNTTQRARKTTVQLRVFPRDDHELLRCFDENKQALNRLGEFNDPLQHLLVGATSTDEFTFFSVVSRLESTSEVTKNAIQSTVVYSLRRSLCCLAVFSESPEAHQRHGGPWNRLSHTSTRALKPTALRALAREREREGTFPKLTHVPESSGGDDGVE